MGDPVAATVVLPTVVTKVDEPLVTVETRGETVELAPVEVPLPEPEAEPEAVVKMVVAPVAVRVDPPVVITVVKLLVVTAETDAPPPPAPPVPVAEPVDEELTGPGLKMVVTPVDVRVELPVVMVLVKDEVVSNPVSVAGRVAAGIATGTPLVAQYWLPQPITIAARLLSWQA